MTDVPDRGHETPPAALVAALADRYRRIRVGDFAGARAVYEELVMMTGHGARSPMCLAMLAAALGDAEAAVGWLRAAYTRKDPQMVVLGLNGFMMWNAVRELPAFEQIRTELKLPDWVERHPR